MNDQEQELYSKPSMEAAREMYYRKVLEQIECAGRMQKFLSASRKSGKIILVDVVCDGISCSSGEILIERLHGQDLIDLMSDWAAGVLIRYRVTAEECRRLWPELKAVKLPIPEKTRSFSQDENDFNDYLGENCP